MTASVVPIGKRPRRAGIADQEFTIAVSDCRFAAVENRDYAVLDDMLRLWRRNNIELSLTGALLLCDGAFVHLLEGDRRDVERMFARVKADPRHENVRLLQRRPLVRRRFENWPLAYVGPSRWVSRALGGIELAQLPADSAEDAAYLIDLILSFVGDDPGEATALSMSA